MRFLLVTFISILFLIFSCNNDEYSTPPDNNIPVDSFMVGYFDFTFRGETYNFVGQRPDGILIGGKPVLFDQSEFDETRQEYFFLNTLQWKIDETTVILGLGLVTENSIILNALEESIEAKIQAMEMTFPLGNKPICVASPKERLYAYFRDTNGTVVNTELCNTNDSFEILETQITEHPDLGTIFGIHAMVSFQLFVDGQAEYETLEGELYYHYRLPNK